MVSKPSAFGDPCATSCRQGVTDNAARATTRFVQMIEQQDPFNTVRALLDAPGISEGFGTLFLKARLDLTVESIATRPEWRHHFTDTQLAAAQQRLDRPTA